MKEITQRGDIILFIDELHNLVGAGAAEGAIDAASILKPALARGELQTIGATTLDEYRKYLERDAALERRFQQIRVDEPSVDDTVQILRGLRDRYEAHHRCKITDEALARRGRARRPLHPGPAPARQGDRPDRRGRVAHAHQDDERAAALPRARGGDREGPQGQGRRDREPGVREGRLAARQGAEAHAEEARARGAVAPTPRPSEQPEVGEEEIADIVSMWTGIPVFKLTEAESQKLIRMEEELHKRVIGQDAGDRRRLEVDPPRARRDQGPEAADRLVHLPRPVGRRQDRARAHARRVPLRRRGRDDPGRHVGVHGEALRVAARRLASGLHRLRRGRPAHRGRPPQAVLGRPARRDREGAPGRVQHPAADPRGREADRRAGPQGRLPEHDRDHDVEHRRRPRSRRTSRSASRSATSRASPTTT